MRIAICFSGQIRTGVESSKYILQYLSTNIEDIDFFMHTWDIETRSVHCLEEEGFEKNDENILISLQPKPLDTQKIEKLRTIYNPISVVIDNFDSYQETRKKIIKDNGYTGETIPMWQSAYESNRLKTEYEKLYGFTYDLVIKMRYDQVFNLKSRIDKEIKQYQENPDILYVLDGPNKWPQMLDDIMWMSNSSLMNLLSDFTFIKEQGEPPLREYPMGYNYGGYIWQIQFTKYVKDLNIKTKKFIDNRSAIYRDFHIDRNIFPILDYSLV